MNASIGMLALRGAQVRVAALSPERRSEIAREAARARWRPRVAHQRLVRECMASLDPREPVPSLSGCLVVPVSRDEARPIILRYEWLGTMGRASAWYGLRAASGDLLGVVGFGQGVGRAARDLCRPEHAKVVINLERGACVHWAPPNAASHLISRACRLAHLEHGWEVFTAYGDPDAGEVGTVYQACGWAYVGQGVGRTPGRKRDKFVRPSGQMVDERVLRYQGVRMTDVPTWRRVQVSPKHRYVHFEGPRREALRAALRYPVLLYPRRPSLQLGGLPLGQKMEKE